MKYLNLLVGLCVAFGGSFAGAQEQTQESEDVIVAAPKAIAITSMQDGDGNSTISQMSVMAFDDGSGPAVFMASPGGMGGGMNLGFGFNSGPMDSFSLLNNPSVQKDLELVDEQIEKIRELNRDFSQRLTKQFQGGLKPENGDKLRELIQEMQREKNEQINGILLEHQQQRLKQVALQSQLNASGTANALASENFRELLGMTEEQIERLKKRSAELQKQMEEKIKKMREEMKDELLGELTLDQRNKLKELLGDQFETRPEDFQSLRRERRVRREREDN